MKKLIKSVLVVSLALAFINLTVFAIAVVVSKSKVESQLENIANQVAMDNCLTADARTNWETALEGAGTSFLTYDDTTDAWKNKLSGKKSIVVSKDSVVQKGTAITVTLNGVVETPFIAFGLNVKLRQAVSATQIVVAQTYMKDLN